MDFKSSLLLNLRPATFKLVLHFPPDVQGFSFELGSLVLGRFLKLVKSVFALNDSRLFH